MAGPTTTHAPQPSQSPTVISLVLCLRPDRINPTRSVDLRFQVVSTPQIAPGHSASSAPQWAPQFTAIVLVNELVEARHAMQLASVVARYARDV
jgi:hypothetical protein